MRVPVILAEAVAHLSAERDGSGQIIRYHGVHVAHPRRCFAVPGGLGFTWMVRPIRTATPDGGSRYVTNGQGIPAEAQVDRTYMIGASGRHRHN
jgi:hypothetical protein